jgi:hypothetical protein
MKALRPGLILLCVQLLLLLSVAGNYLYERETRPRIWTRATQFDPALPLRGRYLALHLELDACDLPREAGNSFLDFYRRPIPGRWNVSLLASNGKVVPKLDASSRLTLTLAKNQPCDRATLNNQELLFIPDRAQLPFPLKPGEELWLEVTLPSSGPPRPLQIAISNAKGFHPLKLN